MSLTAAWNRVGRAGLLGALATGTLSLAIATEPVHPENKLSGEGTQSLAAVNTTPLPGTELYSIAGNGDTYLDLDLDPGMFDFDDTGFEDCTDGLGASDPLARHVVLEGTEVVNNVTSIAAVQAIFERSTGFVLPGVGTFSVHAFSAGVRNGDPIVVTRGGIPEEWDLLVCRGSGASGGSHTVSLGECEDGSLSTTLQLRPRLTFTKRSNPVCVVTIDTGVPISLTSVAPYPWSYDRSTWTIAFGAGVYFDRNCSGSPGVPPVAGSSYFFPGTFVPQCGETCQPNAPVTRLFRLAGPGWGVALHEAVATQDLAEATDTDDDGVLDGADDCDIVADPAQADSDEDGVGDACDNAPAACNPGQADSDGDGVGDVADTCPNDPDDDADGDGVCGDVDNCPAIPNPEQSDLDGDGAADACDPCPLDAANDGDGDGVCGNVDNCPAVSNTDQADADGDTVGDVCDSCPLDAWNDFDHDGICNNIDNCPLFPNPDQADCDGDGIGDPCDAAGFGIGCGGNHPDADGDGFPDDADACADSILDPVVIVPPVLPPPPPPGSHSRPVIPCNSGVPNYLLADGCTISDKIAACDVSTTNNGQFGKCVKSLLHGLRRTSILTEAERRRIDRCVKKYKKRSTRAHASAGVRGHDH